MKTSKEKTEDDFFPLFLSPQKDRVKKKSDDFFYLKVNQDFCISYFFTELKICIFEIKKNLNRHLNKKTIIA